MVKIQKEKIKWIKNNIGMFLSILLVTFTVAVFGPIELYCTNSDEFWFSFNEILIISLILASTFMVFMSLLGVIFKGKGREIYSAIVFALGVALYIQGNYANIDYGILDGKEIDWGAYPVYATFDTIGWIVLVAGLLVLFLKKNKWFTIIQRYGTLYIVAIQMVTLVSLLLMSDATEKKSDYYLSENGMYEVSANENIIIFVLDAFDDEYFQKVYNENPEKYEKVFEDFTYFNNASAAAARTKAALPAILTGEAYPGKISYVDYINQAFNKDGLYTELKKQKYNVGVYTNSTFVPDNSGALVDNQESSGYGVSSYTGLAAKYFELTLYKYMPHIMKQFFWIYSGDFEQYKIGKNSSSYRTDDAAFFSNLELNLNEKENIFRLYHLNGAHVPYTLNEYAEREEEETDVTQQSKGALYIVENYIAQMKELGIYDNSTIIVMADHGDKGNGSHGILFAKTRNSHKPFSISTVPVSYFDLHATLFAELGAEQETTFFNIKEGEERIRKFYQNAEDYTVFYVKEYLITGNMNDSETSKLTGNLFIADVEKVDYKYGTRLTFGADATVVPYIVSGISTIDMSYYSWTDGKESVFEFMFERYPKKDLLVTIDLLTIYDKYGSQEIICYVNDIFCHQETMTGGGSIQFNISKDVIDKDNRMELKLSLPNAVNPYAIEGKGDARTLALALTGLCIEETEEVITQ